MSEEEIKHFAVKATHLFWAVFICIVITAGGIIYSAHEMGKMKEKHGVLQGRVDANEDDIVNFQKARNDYFYKMITPGGKKNVQDN